MSRAPDSSPKARPRGRNLPSQAVDQVAVPVVVGRESAGALADVRSFEANIGSMFERWVTRRSSPHTQRAYRRDVLGFAEFVGIRVNPGPPQTLDDIDARELLRCSVADVQGWRDYMEKVQHRAPKTVVRRLSSLSRFYEYLREQASDFRLPVIVPNPAHKVHLPRDTDPEPVEPTKALTAARVRQLKDMVTREVVTHGDALAHRDKAAVWFYLYTGARIESGCKLYVEDCRLEDAEDPYVLIQEKGKKKRKRRVGVHPEAAEALQAYIESAELTSGPLFRAQRSSQGRKLAERAINVRTMNRLLLGYLERLPRAIREVELPDGTKATECDFTVHSLRATAATELLEAGEDIRAVQELLGHKQVKTTQVYDKRRRKTKESASHRLPY